MPTFWDVVFTMLSFKSHSISSWSQRNSPSLQCEHSPGGHFQPLLMKTPPSRDQVLVTRVEFGLGAPQPLSECCNLWCDQATIRVQFSVLSVGETEVSNGREKTLRLRFKCESALSIALTRSMVASFFITCALIGLNFLLWISRYKFGDKSLKRTQRIHPSIS